MELRFQPATRADAEAMCVLVDSAYEPHDPERAMPERHPSNPSAPPFIWLGGPDVSCWLVTLAEPPLSASPEAPVGFAIWRHVGRNTHLHSFMVAGPSQRGGVGTSLMQFYFAQARRENPRGDTMTLHVRREATWARDFYVRQGFCECNPRTINERDPSGLGDWVRTYAHFGWPPAGKLLMVRSKTFEP